MNKQVITALIFSLLLVSNVFALESYTETDNFVDAITNQPLTGVQTQVISCATRECTEPTQVVVNANSGSQSQQTFTLTYPNTDPANPAFFGEYFAKSGYLPKTFSLQLAGTGSRVFQDNFERGQNCLAVIGSLQAPSQVNAGSSFSVNSAIDSPLFNNLAPFYIPPEMQDEFFSANVAVTAQLRDANNNLVFTQTSTRNLLVNQRVAYLFSIPAPTVAGPATLTITSDPVDVKCEQSNKQVRSQSQVIQIVAQPPVNRAPVFTTNNPITNVVMNEDTIDTSINLKNHFSDPDGDALTFGASFMPNISVSIDQSTGVATLTPSANFNGARSVTFNARDPNGATAVSNTITVTVLPVNDAPRLKQQFPASIAIPEDTTTQLFFLNQFFEDIDGDALTFANNPIQNISITIDQQTSRVQATPQTNFNGNRTVGFQATDTSGASVIGNLVRLQVIGANDAPTLAIPDQLLQRNTQATIDLRQFSNDPDGDTLQFGLLSHDPARVSCTIQNSFNLVLTPANNFVGNATCAIAAQDPNGAQTSDSFNIAVVFTNRPPELLTIPPIVRTTMSEDAVDTSVNLNTHVRDQDGDVLTFTTLNTSNGLSAQVNQQTGVVTLRPALNFNGQAIALYRVADPSGQFVEINHIVTVLPVNDRPGLAPLGQLTMQRNTAADNVRDLHTLATDVETPSNQLVYSIISQSNTQIVTCALDSNRFVDCTAGQATGASTVIIRASDGDLFAEQPLAVNVIAGVNRAPVFSGPIQSVTFVEDTQGNSVNLRNHFSDPDGDAITFSATAIANIAVIINQQTGVVTFTPAANFSGVRNLVFSASDPSGLSANSNNVTITVTPVNDAPFFSPLPPINTQQNSFGDNQVNLTFYAQDIDTSKDLLTFSIVSQSRTDIANCSVDANQSLDCQGGNILGTSTVVVRVSDGSLTGDGTILVTTVAPANRPPVFNNPVNDVSFLEDTVDTSINLRNHFSDPDGDNLTFSASAVQNIQVTINQLTGVVTLTPDGNFSGARNVVFSATDRGGLIANSNSVTITVTPVNDAPTASFTFSPQNPQIFDVLSLVSTSRDVDGDPLDHRWTVLEPGASAPRTISIANTTSYQFTAPGVHEVRLFVSDRSTSRTTAVNFNISGALDITSVLCFPTIIQSHNQSCSAEVVANNNPVPGAVIDFIFTNGTKFGSCTVGNAAKGCELKRVENTLGNFTIRTEARFPGLTPDLNGPSFSYSVIAREYDIVNLVVFNDSAFQQPDSDFFRGENLFASFSARDRSTGQIVTDPSLIRRASLISFGGGRIDLTEVAPMSSAGRYFFAVQPIPLTHGFIGESQVFAFVFNFSDNTGGQEQVNVLIRNNPPQIVGTVPNINTSTTFGLDLTPFESDREDSGASLSWRIEGVDQTLYDAVVDREDLLTVIPKSNGIDTATLVLSDADGSEARQNIQISIFGQTPGSSCTVQTRTIPLREGSNLISFDVTPTNPAIRQVLASIIGDVEIVRTFDGQGRSFDPDISEEFQNDLTTLGPTLGYIITMKRANTLVVTGLEKCDNVIQLREGVNLISYLPDFAQAPRFALQSIDGKYTIVRAFENGQGQTFDPALPPEFRSDLVAMKPGLGYYIRVTQPTTLVYLN